MHPPLLSILSLFSLVLPSLGDRLEADYLRIGGALADYCIIVDSGSRTGDYSALDQFFTPNATFDFGAGVGAVQPLTEVIATFTKTFKKNIITQNAVTTESISVSNDTRSATAISYLTETFFGQGNLSDHIDAVYARLDDNLVKTNQTGNGGWRSRYRKTTYFGSSEGYGDRAVLEQNRVDSESQALAQGKRPRENGLEVLMLDKQSVRDGLRGW